MTWGLLELPETWDLSTLTQMKMRKILLRSPFTSSILPHWGSLHIADLQNPRKGKYLASKTTMRFRFKSNLTSTQWAKLAQVKKEADLKEWGHRAPTSPSTTVWSDNLPTRLLSQTKRSQRSISHRLRKTRRMYSVSCRNMRHHRANWTNVSTSLKRRS